MATDSLQRERNYKRFGCNAFNKSKPTSQPLAFWIEENVWEYIRSMHLSYSNIYNLGYDRTGCMFCMFGCHLEKEPNRFQQMAITHPKQYDYCIKDVEDGGLGLGKVLDYIGVNYKPIEEKEN